MKRLETLEKLHDIKDKYNFNIHHDIKGLPEMVYRHNGKNHHSKLGGKMFSEALLFTTTNLEKARYFSDGMNQD